ncbi:hypothetical protein EDC04DRAFT_3086835 [Pisolithus marmoratus]|nr:hypothetical protein EDC04DRAFT_3086835 [Pisolithus marmoratus]
MISLPDLSPYLHPALPGRFDGANAVRRGYEAFQCDEVDKLGVMGHRVVAEVDQGVSLIVREVSIEKGESIQVYEGFHEVEWEIIGQATRRIGYHPYIAHSFSSQKCSRTLYPVVVVPEAKANGQRAIQSRHTNQLEDDSDDLQPNCNDETRRVSDYLGELGTSTCPDQSDTICPA